RTLPFGQALERVVMEDHGFAVGRELEIAFDGIAAGDGRGESRNGILDHAVCGVMQAAVRNRARDQPVETGHQLRRQETSNIPSTSTAASSGRTETPIVVRA